MNVKNTLVGALAIIAFIFGVLYFKSNVSIIVPPLDIKLDATKLGSAQVPAPVVNVEAAKPIVVPAPVVNVNVPKQDAPSLGSVAGQDIFFRSYFHNGITIGSSILATTSDVATYTTVAKDFANLPTVMSWLPNKIITISLSATSTHQYVPNVGDTAKIYLWNASSTAAANITFAAADANTDIQIYGATGANLIVPGEGWVELTLIRRTAYIVSVLVGDFAEGD